MNASAYILRVERRAAAMYACATDCARKLLKGKQVRCTCPPYDGSQTARDAVELFRRMWGAGFGCGD